MKIKPAAGERGFLIRGFDGTVWFRQYDIDHNFVDYDITHYDCEIVITDTSAALITAGDAAYLDYTAEAMGIEEKK